MKSITKLKYINAGNYSTLYPAAMPLYLVEKKKKAGIDNKYVIRIRSFSRESIRNNLN